MSLVTPPKSRLSRRTGAIVGSALLIAVVAVPGLALASVRPAATTGTIHGCANKKSGALRVAASCSSAERAVVWSIQGQRGAAGAAGKAGANGVTGPVGPAGVAGDPGANGATGPQGSPGPSGPPGPSGSPGTPGATGPSGVVSLHIITGSVAGNALPQSDTWTFVGPKATVTLLPTESISGSVSASMGVLAGSPTQVDIDFCYQVTSNVEPNPNPVTTFYGDTFVTTQLSAPKQIVNFSGAMGAISDVPVTYGVGLCASSSGAIPINQNDDVSGWFQVSNGGVSVG